LLVKNSATDAVGRQISTYAETFDAMTARRVHALDGDISVDGLALNETDRALLAYCDIIIHSAASVSFDSPLDSAVEVNLLGPTRLAALLNELHPSGTNMPHLVAVSTCYVAGNRRGTAPEQLVSEGPFDIGLSWKAEVASARRLRHANPWWSMPTR
jgi:thioester reductase-like protein